MRLPAFLLRPLAAMLDAAEWSPDRSRRAVRGDRYVLDAEDRAVGDDRLAVIAECRDLMRNSPVTRGVVERVREIVVGSTGIVPESDSGDAAWDAAAEALWRAWAEDPEGTGRGDLADLQGMAEAALLTDGGLALHLNGDGTVTAIEADRLLPDPAGAPGSQPFRLDGRGRVVAWCVHDRGLGGKARWVPAGRMLTLFARTRPDQILGLPQLTPVANTVRDMEELNRYTLRQAKVQAVTAAIHTRGASGESPFRLRNTAQADADEAEAANVRRFEKASGCGASRRGRR